MITKRKGTLTIVSGDETPVRYVVKCEMGDLNFQGGKTVAEAYNRGRRDEDDVCTYVTGDDPVYTGTLQIWCRGDILEGSSRAQFLAVQAILRGKKSYTDPTTGNVVSLTPTGGPADAPLWTVELKHDLSGYAGTTKDMLTTLKNVDFPSRTESDGDLYTIQAQMNIRSEPAVTYPARS